MITVTIQYPSIFIDKPNVATIELIEEDVAMEKKDESTGRFVKLSVGELFKAFQNRQLRIKENVDTEELVDHTYFEMWFYEKHLKSKPYYNRILNMSFSQQ
jgi:hypothetical protein